MASHRPLIFPLIIICFLTVTFFYLEYNSLEDNSNALTSKEPISGANNASQLNSTTFKKVSKQIPKKSTSRHKQYGPIPFREKMECDGYHEKKGISFQQLWNWPPVRVFIGIWT
ncbi:2939_t:CDS:1, partial [Funneliformis caledonium]